MLSVLLASTLGLVLSNDLPKGTMGFYCLIADDSYPNYTSTDVWQPALYPYQQTGANVLWLTFINPTLMPAVPPAMAALAKCKGQAGCPNVTTPVIFSIGGEAYSLETWPWLESQSAAESMAAEVAQWDTKYGADGIDLDLETGPSGNSQTQANNLVAFATKLRELNPKMYITQPVYGYPGVVAENTMVNQGFKSAPYKIDSVGIMDYQDLSSLNYVKNYENATSQWQGFPITSDVPSTRILAGIQGQASSGTIGQMASDIVSKQLGGIMVWFGSVKDTTRNRDYALSYRGTGDASKTMSSNGGAWQQAMDTMNA